VKVTASEIEGSQVVLDMEIEQERLDKAVERAYRSLASRVNVPGFRRGKAPRGMVERLIGRDTIIQEAIEILIPEVYKEAVRETGIEPVAEPKLDIVSAEPLSVKATVPVRPKVELGDYRSIRQSLEVPEVTDEQVDRTIERLRDAHATWTVAEREAREGDLVTMDIKIRVDDRTLMDRQGVNVILNPEQPIVAPGAVEQILGMTAGERKAFDVTMPQDFPDKEVAGKDAVFEVGITEVKEKHLPSLDDEFARTVGEFADLEALRQAVRKELEEQAAEAARHNLEESVLAAVIDQAKADPPTPWVEEQARAIRADTERTLGRQGLSLEQFLDISNRSEESFEEEAMSAARAQLKRTLVLDAIADIEGIEVSDEELEPELQQAIARRGGRVDPAQRERLARNLRALLRERKTVERLVAIATGALDQADRADTETPSAAESRTEVEA